MMAMVKSQTLRFKMTFKKTTGSHPPLVCGPSGWESKLYSKQKLIRNYNTKKKKRELGTIGNSISIYKATLLVL